MTERKIGATRRNEATRIDIQEKPLGPMPGFSLSIPRCVVNIIMPDKRVDNAELIAIAQEQMRVIIGFGKHYCAMAFHFWTDKKVVGKEEARAVVDFGPDGKWEDALKAKIADYSKHSFKVMHNRTGGEGE